MKSLQAPNLKTIVLTKTMYMIRSYDEQAFDNMSEESGKKNYRSEIVLACSKSGHGWAGKKTWRLQTPARLPRKRLKTPDNEVAKDHLMKDIIK